MGGFLGGSIRKGSWWLNSPSDSRWNDQGRCHVGGLTLPADAQTSIDKNKKLLGIEPPEDLEWGYMKD